MIQILIIHPSRIHQAISNIPDLISWEKPFMVLVQHKRRDLLVRPTQTRQDLRLLSAEDRDVPQVNCRANNEFFVDGVEVHVDKLELLLLDYCIAECAVVDGFEVEFVQAVAGCHELRCGDADDGLDVDVEFEAEALNAAEGSDIPASDLAGVVAGEDVVGVLEEFDGVDFWLVAVHFLDACHLHVWVELVDFDELVVVSWEEELVGLAELERVSWRPPVDGHAEPFLKLY